MKKDTETITKHKLQFIELENKSKLEKMSEECLIELRSEREM